ncbi:MAG: hypothetical protein V3W06_05165, partial [Acidimicrobiia bacterium]
VPETHPPPTGRTRPSLLRTCPDCAGILEPIRPGWVAVIDAATAATPQQTGPVRWQCLICGYRE